ncbi:hypothetical protein D3C71_1562830 [compost metagenome]
MADSSQGTALPGLDGVAESSCAKAGFRQQIVRITALKALDQLVACEAVFFPRGHVVARAASLGLSHRIQVDGQAAKADVLKVICGLSCTAALFKASVVRSMEKAYSVRSPVDRTPATATTRTQVAAAWSWGLGHPSLLATGLRYRCMCAAQGGEAVKASSANTAAQCPSFGARSPV